jgi:hypothetical protein
VAGFAVGPESQSGSHSGTVLTHEHAAFGSNAVLHGFRRASGVTTALVVVCTPASFAKQSEGSEAVRCASARLTISFEGQTLR